MRSSQEAEIFWKDHILKSNESSEGIGAYLKVNNLTASSFYRWRTKLSKSKSSKVQVLRNKKLPAFLPVQVESSRPTPKFENKPIDHLPEAKWVADVLINLVVGLR